MMKKVLMVLLVFAIALTVVSTAFAAPPCNDMNGDGSPSGYEYAQYHIAEAAKNGVIGRIHKPGVVHNGFSVCH